MGLSDWDGLSNYIRPYPRAGSLEYEPDYKDIADEEALLKKLMSFSTAQQRYSEKKRMIHQISTAMGQGINWAFVSHDSAAKIIDFYAKESNRRGWMVYQDGPMSLELKRKGLRLRVFLPRFAGERSTFVIYSLQER